MSGRPCCREVGRYHFRDLRNKAPDDMKPCSCVSCERVAVHKLGEPMSHWTLDDVPWKEFDAAKVNPELVRIVKAASLVEYNGHEYVKYLCNVFDDDAALQTDLRRWG